MHISSEPKFRPGNGWASLLARLASAALLFELISGFAITFGPFHAVVEWDLLLHTLFGVLTLAPVGVYLWRHFEDYRGQAMSDVLLLGYVALLAMVLCTVSGVMVTWQGLFSTRTDALWRYIHLLSALVTLAAVLPHLVLAWMRRRATQFARPAARWFAFIAASSFAGVLLTGALAYLYSGTRYRNQFPSDYNFLYGKDRPFAPSLARTATGGAFDARSLSGSESCGSSGCQSQIYEEWKPSAHRYAAMDKIFLGIQNVMAKQNGPESTRYCGGCHDPISLFSGTKNIFVENLTSLEGYREGISCVACHSIQKTDIRGNANYTITQPREYLWQWSGSHGLAATARNFLIRTYPAEHNRLSKRMYKNRNTAPHATSSSSIRK